MNFAQAMQLALAGIPVAREQNPTTVICRQHRRNIKLSRYDDAGALVARIDYVPIMSEMLADDWGRWFKPTASIEADDADVGEPNSLAETVVGPVDEAAVA